MLKTCDEVKFNYARSVGRICKLKAEHLSILFGLLHPITWKLVVGFGFNDCDRDVSGVAKKIVSTFLFQSFDIVPGNDNSPIRKRPLLSDGAGRIIPACLSEPGNDVFSAGISFVGRDASPLYSVTFLLYEYLSLSDEDFY